MSLSFFLFAGLITLLLLLFVWALRKPASVTPRSSSLSDLEDSDRRHVTYLPQIRQALAQTDYHFLSETAPRNLQRRVRRERRSIALSYVSALRDDFEGLLRMARVIAVLSPEVAAVQEFERLRLTVRFTWRYECIRLKLLLGFVPLLQLGGLSELVSGLSARMELAIKELGERAALARDLGSSLNRSGVGLV